MRYSIVTSTGPASGSIACDGTSHSGLAGVRSSSSAPPSIDGAMRCTNSSATEPSTADTSRLVRTSLHDATCPHSAAPPAAPPISAI